MCPLNRLRPKLAVFAKLSHSYGAPQVDGTWGYGDLFIVFGNSIFSNTDCMDLLNSYGPRQGFHACSAYCIRLKVFLLRFENDEGIKCPNRCCK